MQLNRGIRNSRRPIAWHLGGVVLLALGGLAGEIHAQAQAKANYVAEATFQLPPKGQPGGPDRPTALTVAPGGEIHVLNARGPVFVYDAAGVYRRAYGGSELDRPVAIAATVVGEYYVLDAGRNEVRVYGPGGQPLRGISGKGSRGGQLSKPVDLALGPNGFLYVLDAGRNGIQIFSWDGLFVRDIPLGDALRDPASLAVGLDGTVFVADRRAPNHVFAFPPFNQVPWTRPIQRTIAGKIPFRGAALREPVATVVNERGTVIVLDQKAGRLFRANPMSGRQLGSDDLLYGGLGSGRGSFQEAVDVAFAGHDELLILDAKLRKLERIKLTTEEGLEPRTELAFPIRVSRVAGGLPEPLVTVGYGSDGVVRFLMEGDRTATLMGGRPEMRAGVYGDSVRVLVPDPTVAHQRFAGDLREIADGVITDSTVIIVDPRRNRFSIFDIGTGMVRGSFGDNYQDSRRLKSPRGLAMLSDGRIVIADTDNSRVKIFSADLASLVGNYPFVNPAGIAVAPDDAILAWNQDGTIVGRLGTTDESIEAISEEIIPRPVADMAFDQAGNLFVLDGKTHRVTIIEAGLERLLIQLGAEGGLDRPARIRVDREGNIYVADTGSGRTLIFRWDVQVPALTGFDLDFEGDAAILRWQATPSRFVRGYEVQVAMEAQGPFTPLALAEAAPFRLSPEQFGEQRPRYVRLAPVFLTGVSGRATDALPLSYFNISVAYRRGDYQTALDEAREATRLIEAGAIDAGAEVKGQILRIAFASAYELGDLDQAIEWARKATEIPMQREAMSDFVFKLAEVHLRRGEPRQAGEQILTLMGHSPRPEFLRQQTVIDQSFRVYRALRDGGYPEDALEFMRFFHEAVPPSTPDVKALYGDSLAVFETRARLAPGIQYWKSADYTQVIAFLENFLSQSGLTAEERVVALQLVACAYYAFGRRYEAEERFRDLFNFRPSFNIEREVPRLQALYGLTLYNPDMLDFFGRVRPRF